MVLNSKGQAIFDREEVEAARTKESNGICSGKWDSRCNLDGDSNSIISVQQSWATHPSKIGCLIEEVLDIFAKMS